MPSNTYWYVLRPSFPTASIAPLWNHPRFEKEELQSPSPRKELDGTPIYLSRELGVARELDIPIQCDFDSAMFGDMEHLEDVQRDIYRAPEVILQIPWTYNVDIYMELGMYGKASPLITNIAVGKFSCITDLEHLRR